jgi:hypothetical protein
LKAQWVEKAKIKSKWKAQKRKEGLLKPRPTLENDHSGLGDALEAGPIERLDTASETSGNEDEHTASEPGPDPELIPPKPQNIRRKNASSPAKTYKNQTGGFNDRPSKTEPSERVPSLRDRAREAYSAATLHTYKSTSFQKGGRGRGAGARARGGGQPNMKLRMGVMLEKIKANYS